MPARYVLAAVTGNGGPASAPWMRGSRVGRMVDDGFARLGKVVQLQVHTDRMVRDGHYHHELIERVDELWLGTDGVLGCRGSDVLVHAHHRLHPNKNGADARDFRPNRLLSIGFTGHHDLIVERFGPQLLGSAAEDVMVDCGRRVTLAEIAGGVQVRRRGAVVELVDGAVAKPCVPYTKFLLADANAPADVVAPNRSFLEDGMRGFVFGLTNHAAPVAIQVGDEVWARPA